MTTARQIITRALGFRLNRLSPGEALDADLAATCLEALNDLTDTVNGAKSGLFRIILTAGTVTGATGTLGTTWATLEPGDKILGATYRDGLEDEIIDQITMEQYHVIGQKTNAGDPEYFAHDGLATVYFYPVPTSRSVTLRTKAAVSEFADLDTDYVMPQGYQSAFSSLLAELLAPQMGGITPAIARDAANARSRMRAQGMTPAIINGYSRRPNIITGDE